SDVCSSDLGNLGKDFVHEVAQQGHHRGAEDDEHDGDRRQLRDERQRLLVDRGRGLDQPDHQAYREAGEQHRGGDQRRGPEHAVGEREKDGQLVHQTKLAAREPISSAHPSTRTNSSSLKGKDTSIGLIIIMPRLISTLETTRSITRNGRNSMKPIWNAVLSSLVTKAGSRIENGTSASEANFGASAMSANIARSVSRVWRIMNAWNWSPALEIACSAPICPAE